MAVLKVEPINKTEQYLTEKVLRIFLVESISYESALKILDKVRKIIEHFDREVA